MMKKDVVLVHGLLVHGLLMFAIKRAFEKAGYRVHVFSYKTTHYKEEEVLMKFKKVIDNCASSSIDFVAHSMGGLVVRKFVEKFPSKKYKKIVTLGTPHRGSFMAKLLSSSKLNRLVGINDTSGLLKGIGDYESNIPLGSISGNKPVGVLGSYLRILGKEENLPHDGVVYVSETIDKNFKDVITLPCSHSGMLFSREVFDQVLYFLDHGFFKK